MSKQVSYRHGLQQSVRLNVLLSSGIGLPYSMHNSRDATKEALQTGLHVQQHFCSTSNPAAGTVLVQGPSQFVSTRGPVTARKESRHLLSMCIRDSRILLAKHCVPTTTATPTAYKAPCNMSISCRCCCQRLIA
jgi:hypothetical protein